MIRLTLRQFRTEALIGFAGLAALAVVLGVTAHHLVDLHQAYLSACGNGRTCTGDDPVLGAYHPLQVALIGISLLLPALVGVFWGAPLVSREIESGTYRLAWTQSVSRRRWLAVKLALLGTASAALGGAVGLLANWWASPIMAASGGRFSPGTFSLMGIVPAGYAAFAFALGVLSGLVLRRSVPAMATTLVGFVGARLAVTVWLRPRLLAPLHAIVPFGFGKGIGIGQTAAGLAVVADAPSMPGAWVYSASLVDNAGRTPGQQFLQEYCPGVVNAYTGARGGGPAGGKSAVVTAIHQAFQQCAATVASRVHTVVTYQPPSRYWPLQWYETGVFVAAALVLAGVAFWWGRRRLA